MTELVEMKKRSTVIAQKIYLKNYKKGTKLNAIIQK